MKKGTFITLISAILLLMAVNPVYAQEANGFKKFDVKEDFTENDIIRLLPMAIAGFFLALWVDNMYAEIGFRRD